jgi:uncharacterized protein (TIGR02246 family)
MEHWELEARESIRDLVARYNASGDAGRFDELLALFAEDGVLEVIDGETARGREQIRSLVTRAARSEAPAAPAGEKPRVLRHFTATHQIDIQAPDAATGRCYYAVLTADGLDHWGRYQDRYVREAERWRFASRRVSVDAAVPDGWAARASTRPRSG